MILTGFLFLLFLTDGAFPECNCSYQEVLNHLDLTKNNEMYSMTRPVKNYKRSTRVSLEVLLYAILDVNEKEQTFISCLWVDMIWKHKSFSWDSREFCGIKDIHLPAKDMWTPDLTIEEMTEKDKALPSPYLLVKYNGDITYRNIMVVTSTCMMEVYKFPFDVQSCNLTFKSIIYTDTYIELREMNNADWTNKWAKETMQKGSEWLFVDIKTNIKNKNNFGFEQSMLVYTITMKRRPVLYVANFLLPILFFFFLDLASFLISDSGGEKLSFKVTVLLAVTVMQLILNEILPTTSDRVPLVAVYCIGMFGLMMISLFETILVMYLMGKDIEADEDQRPKSEDCEDKGSKGSSSELTEESVALEKLSDEMKEVIQLLNTREEAGKIGYWTRVAKTINKVEVPQITQRQQTLMIF
ncbi:5-hydroxytryptamine receptor 3A-like [Centropristis striata]|uniref:5-hydroxytryptamine receptor 3A-like n=1 Tax=Centropristis striata TaxID=184440 RepID=UPI0027DFD0BF|nr:5-hydroxytryptamine receptor 3A-like [Centropristis striata]